MVSIPALEHFSPLLVQFSNPLLIRHNIKQIGTSFPLSSRLMIAIIIPNFSVERPYDHDTVESRLKTEQNSQEQGFAGGHSLLFDVTRT